MTEEMQAHTVDSRVKNKELIRNAVDKYGRTAKQKRKEDFLVNTISVVLFLSGIAGAAYYAYTIISKYI